MIVPAILKARILFVFFGIALDKNRGYLRVRWRLRVEALSGPDSKLASIRKF